MVVLSVGLTPPEDFKDLSSKFDIALNAHGFCKTDPVNPMQTTHRGIFINRAFQGPVTFPSCLTGPDGNASMPTRFPARSLSPESCYPWERATGFRLEKDGRLKSITSSRSQGDGGETNSDIHRAVDDKGNAGLGVDGDFFQLDRFVEFLLEGLLNFISDIQSKTDPFGLAVDVAKRHGSFPESHFYDSGLFNFCQNIFRNGI